MINLDIEVGSFKEAIEEVKRRLEWEGHDIKKCSIRSLPPMAYEILVRDEVSFDELLCYVRMDGTIKILNEEKEE